MVFQSVICVLIYWFRSSFYFADCETNNEKKKKTGRYIKLPYGIRFIVKSRYISIKRPGVGDCNVKLKCLRDGYNITSEHYLCIIKIIITRRENEKIHYIRKLNNAPGDMISTAIFGPS